MLYQMSIFRVKKPSCALLALIFVILFYGAGTIFPRLAWIIIITVFLFGFFVYLYNRKIKIDRPTIMVYLLSSSWLLFPAIWGLIYKDPIINYKLLLESLLYILFSIYVYSWLKKDECRYEVMTKYLVCIWILVSVSLFLFYKIGVVTYENTFSGPYTNRNLYSIVSTLLIICSLFFVKNRKTKIVYVVFLISTVLLTASIKGLVGVVLVLYMYKMKKFNVSKIIYFTLILSVVIFSVLQTDTLISQRLNALVNVVLTIDLSGMGSASERLWLIVNGTSLALDNWFTGIGLYNSKHYLFPPWQLLKAERSSEVLSVGLYTHNNYLEVFLSVGIFGLTFYYFPHLYLLFRSVSKLHYGNKMRFCWVFVSYKLFLDVAMVSYNSFPLVFFYILSLMFVFDFRKRVY